MEQKSLYLPLLSGEHKETKDQQQVPSEELLE